MKLHKLHEREIPAKAQELIDFDMDSIRQIVSAERLKEPKVWLANPDQYENGGRILRDSTSPRMLAYSPERKVLFATDGCNSCAHYLKADLKELDEETLRSFANESKIQPELLDRIVAILKNMLVN
ncbi:MAG TPA: hypothetical protein VK210_13130 [Terriglobia bacterium]|nr:hypothetical protein [Terriglobia bacterium]